MTTHKTLVDARAISGDAAVVIVEIDHATEGRCFIRVKAPMKMLAYAVGRGSREPYTKEDY